MASKLGRNLAWYFATPFADDQKIPGAVLGSLPRCGCILIRGAEASWGGGVQGRDECSLSGDGSSGSAALARAMKSSFEGQWLPESFEQAWTFIGSDHTSGVWVSCAYEASLHSFSYLKDMGFIYVFSVWIYLFAFLAIPWLGKG